MVRIYVATEEEMRALLALGERLGKRAAEAAPVTAIAGERFIHAEHLSDLSSDAQAFVERWTQSVGYDAALPFAPQCGEKVAGEAGRMRGSADLEGNPHG